MTREVTSQVIAAITIKTCFMTIDKLLSRIVPLELGLGDKSNEMRRTVKLFLAVLIVFAIVYTAIWAARTRCVEGASEWYVIIMTGWHIILHGTVYYIIVTIAAALCGDLRDTLDEIVVDNCIRHIREEHNVTGTQVQPKVRREFTKNKVFSPCIDEGAVIEYIRSNQDRFALSEDIAIFFFIMQKNGYIGTSMKMFHTLMASLVPCRSYDQLSHSLQRVKEIYNYYESEEKRVKLVHKCALVEDIIKGFLHDEEAMKGVIIIKREKKLTRIAGTRPYKGVTE